MVNLGIVSIRLAAIALLSCAPAVASAGPIEDARSMVDELRYEEATEALDGALESGANDMARLTDIYFLKATIAAALGDTEGSATLFRVLLEINPAFRLPANLSPKIVTPYNAARERAAPPKISHRIKDDAVHVTIEAKGQRLITEGRALLTSAGVTRQVVAEGSIRLTFDISGPRPLSIQILLTDRWGNTIRQIPESGPPLLVEAKRTPAAKTSPPPPVPIDNGSPGRAWWRSPYLWGGAFAATTGTAVAFALAARSNQGDYDDLIESGSPRYSDLRNLEDRGNRNSTLANVFLGAAGAVAVVGSLVLFTDLFDSGGDAEIAPTVTKSSVGAVAQIHF